MPGRDRSEWITAAFTPRALIRTMVECMRPEPCKAIADPACGTGGFLLGACDFLNDPEHYRLDRQQKELLKYDTWRRLLAQFRKLAAGLEKG